MGRSKRLRISQTESEAAAPAPARTSSSFSGPTVTPTPVPAPTPSPVPAPTPSQSTEPPPETTQHFTSSPTSTPISAPIPDEVSKQCNRYWTIDIIDVATFPISYHSWDKVPNSYKESCFNSIKGKFCLDRVLEKHFIIRKLGKNWRNYRCFLFGQFYKVEKTREQNLEEHSPKFIPLDMWAAFVDYRLDPKTNAMSEKNRENRSKLTMPHTCGSKSMARKKHEMELASGKPVSRGAVFVATHKRKDGSYLNDNAKIVSEKILEIESQETSSTQLSEMDSLGQVLGKENLGRVRGLRFGPSPTQVFGHATTRLGRIPLNSGSDPAGDVALQENARLKLQLEANKSQTKSFMTFVLQNLGLESVPPELADLINPQVSDANSAEPSSTGHQSSEA